MSQALAETIGYVNRARAFMPPGTVPPFVMRFDTGSVPVGYLVLSSKTRSIGEIQDQALFKVRPMFASLPGVSAPPPFGGNQRTIVVRTNPDRLRAYNISPEELVERLDHRQSRQPVGKHPHAKDQMPIVPVDSMVVDPQGAGKHRRATGGRRLRARSGHRRRQHRHSRPATPSSTASGPSTSWSPNGPKPRRSAWSTRSKPTWPTCRRPFPRTLTSASSLTSRRTCCGRSGASAPRGFWGPRSPD